MTDPLVASRQPFAVELVAGQTYFWCACGRSQNQPFCDGSHKGSGIAPVKFVAAGGERLWLCGCKRSANPPFCDGSHKQLPPADDATTSA